VESLKQTLHQKRPTLTQAGQRIPIDLTISEASPPAQVPEPVLEVIAYDTYEDVEQQFLQITLDDTNDDLDE
jgi:hypothetical protein